MVPCINLVTVASDMSMGCDMAWPYPCPHSITAA